MKRISVILLALAACLLLLTAAAFAADETAETLTPEENAETVIEEAADEGSGEETPVDDEETPADGEETAAAEAPSDDEESADDEAESVRTQSAPSGSIIQPGWVQGSNGSWYYYNTDSTLKTGWLQSGSSWYYLDPDEDGKMVAGTTMTIGKAEYRFDDSGIMLTGWYEDSDGSWYYYASNGAQKTGWLQSGSSWYYLDPDKDGKMAVGTTMTIDEAEYRFKSSGAMYVGWYENSKEEWYYYASSGAKKTGWLQSGSTWYYLDPDENGKMVAGTTMTISEAEYRFKSSGAMYTGWYKDSDGKWYYYASGGAMYTGWVKYNSYWYYLNSDGTMATGVTEIGDNSYWLNSSGAMVTDSWKYYNNSWHYFTRYGRMAKSCWVYIPESGGNYYFYEDGSMAVSTKIDGISINSSGISTYYASNMTTRIQGYSSPTDYMLVVDRSTCKFYIYKGSTYNWSLYDWSYCACGAASTPTPSGTYYLGGGANYFDSGSSRCFYYRDITSRIAFHSVLYYQNGYTPYTASVMTATVGARISHGCVRLPLAQDLWVYNYAPAGTTVVIF